VEGTNLMAFATVKMWTFRVTAAAVVLIVCGCPSPVTKSMKPVAVTAPVQTRYNVRSLTAQNVLAEVWQYPGVFWSGGEVKLIVRLQAPGEHAELARKCDLMVSILDDNGKRRGDWVLQCALDSFSTVND
jgi:hypothetical protein